jgi:cell division protein FtsB
LDSRVIGMKPFLNSAVKYFQLAFLFVSVSSVGILMGEKGLTQKYRLEEKKESLSKENKILGMEIKALERKITLLRSDQKTIEKTAKKKLGMCAPEETVYVFEKRNQVSARSIGSEPSPDTLEIAQ